MNLLMVSGDASPAQGRQGAFAEMLREFAPHWGRVDIIVPHAPGAEPLRFLDNVFFWVSPLPRHLQPYFIVKTGSHLARERNYALIASHDYGLFYNGVGSAALSRRIGVPYVSEIHHVEGYPRAATVAERFQRQVAFLYVEWAKRRAAAFRVVNDSELPSLLRARGVSDKRILVLHSLYLDFEVFRPERETPKYDVAFVGRLAPNKGLLLLLDGVARAKKALGRIRVAVIGDGPQKANIVRRAEQLGLADDVRFIGWLPRPVDVARLYNQTRVLVCSSFSEGGPRVVAEALACGTPVISTPVGMARELVRENENGCLFEWDSAELAEKLERVLKDETLRQRMAQAAPASVARFDKRTVISEYARAYQRLAVA